MARTGADLRETLIADGVSGVLAPDEAGAVAAVGRLGAFDRAAVRAHAARFSVDRMVDAYLHAYRVVLAGTGAPQPPAQA